MRTLLLSGSASLMAPKTKQEKALRCCFGSCERWPSIQSQCEALSTLSATGHPARGGGHHVKVVQTITSALCDGGGGHEQV
jgi:hypothetical protein